MLLQKREIMYKRLDFSYLLQHRHLVNLTGRPISIYEEKELGTFQWSADLDAWVARDRHELTWVTIQPDKPDLEGAIAIVEQPILAAVAVGDSSDQLHEAPIERVIEAWWQRLSCRVSSTPSFIITPNQFSVVNTRGRAVDDLCTPGEHVYVDGALVGYRNIFH